MMCLRPASWISSLLLLVSYLQRGAQSFSVVESSSVDALLTRARSLLDIGKDADAAFGVLTQVYQQDPTAQGLQRLFERCFRLRILMTGNIQDRFGLASLLLDQERYDEASQELRTIVDTPEIPSQVHEKASSMLFRTNAACCQWDSIFQDSQALVQLLNLGKSDHLPVVHPFEALKWPCLSLEQATRIASLYARRAVVSQGQEWKDMPSPQPQREVIEVSRAFTFFPKTKLKLGYISPDFTSMHPLAFLMQDVFQNHNRDYTEVKLYSLSKPEDCPEVNVIRDGSDSYVTLSRGMSAKELAETIRDDDLDVLIDLCGYAGTSLISEILMHRPSPLQVSYMGFPGSSGAPYLDYLVCDPVVVPPELRHHYTEKIIWMPHCYFVNSHRKFVPTSSANERLEARRRYGLKEDAFVFCCHSRPDKIDPTVFHTWMKALITLKNENVVLWLLQSGPAMEKNLRQIAEKKYGLSPDCLVFCEISPKNEHLQRLGCADVFLDTPAYNAHTLGCDALWAGVPMISLLRPLVGSSNIGVEDNGVFVATEKLASRVGASLLTACGLEEMIVPDLSAYQAMMVKAGSDRAWFRTIQTKLEVNKHLCPLFDTKRWVENLELALLHIVLSDGTERLTDIRIADLQQ